MENVRDPLVLVYQTLKKAIKTVHGQDFLVLDDFPTADSYRKQNRNAANISFISASSEKGLMREFVPHKTVKNNTDNKFTIVIETLRMEYVIQISFFADRKGIYPHDDFVKNNMSEEGYKKMREALKKYVKNLEIRKVK